ncbi:MAG TPA: MOSC domain-containing protein [Microthrixaceae bacterium]|jgi:MOSC domain-containing protein YiiM|nr:MOSC domain-containing protein [Microthrixaceae bacterium]HQF95280.1 MOSC domain-containing protein [Microthrixaceae bacterium]
MPDSIRLAAVNVGTPKVLADHGGDRVWSGIGKRPLPPDTTLFLSLVNLAGDGQADLTVHGGIDKAVYAYPSEHLPAWAAELGEALGDAPFGENLSTIGVTESDVRIGDRWEWGEALLEVCQPRSPCFKLALHRRRADIQQLFRQSGRVGWYLRVLHPGAVSTGSDISVIERDAAGLTVADAHRAMGDRRLEDRTLVEALAAHDRLADEWRLPLVERLARR